MDANIWFIISVIGFSLSGVLFIIAVFMFIKLNIPAIIGDLTGYTAAKQIKEIRERNITTGEKRFKPDAFNLDRGKLTERFMNRSKQVENEVKVIKDVTTNNTAHGTDKTKLLTEDTEVLINETVVLSEEINGANDGTEVLTEQNHSLATELLVDDLDVKDEFPLQGEATTVLGNTEELTHDQYPLVHEIEFKLVKDIKVTHTDEVI